MSTKPPTLTRLQFAYKLEDQAPEVCAVHNRSMIAWDETRGKRKWPDGKEAPFLWMTFLVWHHLSRTGVYSSDFPTFQEECEAIESFDPDEDADPDDEGYAEAPVDPTPAGLD